MIQLCRRRVSLWIATSGLLFHFSQACFSEPEAYVAKVVALSGEVFLKKTQTSSRESIQSGQLLFEGNLVETGAEASAVLEFVGGHRLTLGPNTTLLVQKNKAATTQIGAVLLSGSAQAVAVRGIHMTIGTPLGFTEIGENDAQVSLSSDGLRVLVGEVTFMGTDGATQTLKNGQTVTVAGLTMVLPPLQVKLVAKSKAAQLMRRGQTDWQVANGDEEVAWGDAVRAKKGPAQLQFAQSASVYLTDEAEVTLLSAKGDGQAQQVGYRLNKGAAVVQMAGDVRSDFEHQIETAGAVMKIQPTVHKAQVQVRVIDNNSAEVAVQFGQAKLADGAIIRAGTRAQIKNGVVQQEVQPLADTLVEVVEKSKSVVYYVDKIPPLRFSWQATNANQPVTLELARNASFNDAVVQEQVQGGGFILQAPTPGKFFWRVKQGDQESQGSLAIEKARDEDCSRCRRTNIIDNSGEKTVVYFQKTLPSITFRWKEIPGASRYRIKIFEDGDFDRPFIDQTVLETSLSFAAGRFVEGRYYWMVVGQTSAEKDMAAGDLNSLTISYDNAVTELLIKAPRNGEKTNARSIQTRGEIQLGSDLIVNGKKMDIDAKGRFSGSVLLEKGENILVYQSKTEAGVYHYYLRRVLRR